MQKIIFSNYDDRKNPYYGGGGAIAIHEVAKRLAASINVIVVTGKYPGSKNQVIDRVQYKRIGLSFLGPKLGQLLFIALLPLYVLTMRFDAWCESFTPPISTAFLPLFTKKPVIGVAHMLAGAGMQRKYKMPFCLIEQYGLRFYKTVVVLTQGQKKIVAKFVKPKTTIAVIPNGVTVKSDDSKLQLPDKYLLYLGRIDIDQKGLDLLLAAVKKNAGNYPHKLIIAGNGVPAQERALKAQIVQQGLTGQVQLIGKITGKDKQRLFSKATLTVIPSRFESFGMIALEAMAYGCPVVLFDIEGFKWIPNENCIKVYPFDVKRLAQVITELVHNAQLRHELITRGKTLAQQYSWDAVAQQYVSLLTPLLTEVGAMKITTTPRAS